MQVMGKSGRKECQVSSSRCRVGAVALHEGATQAALAFEQELKPLMRSLNEGAGEWRLSDDNPNQPHSPRPRVLVTHGLAPGAPPA